MRRRKTGIFFLIFGISLSALAVALNVGWILLNLTEVVLLVFGIIFFALIITGIVLNTIFLVREIRKNEQHDAFLNAVTHELKTPIASIKLYLETLKNRDVAPEKQREFYDIMLADNDRLLNTVEQVLSASKTGDTRKRYEVEELDIDKLLEDCVDIVRSRYNLEPGAIRIAEIQAGLRILGDSEALQTAFVNLLDNAVKYSPDDPKVSVRVKASPIRNRIDIFIRDNGVGMETAELKRVFKRFYRVPQTDGPKIKGTGLGLFIVNSIIKKHGGSIRADSKGEGRGSTFIVQLPKA
ncbi:MAG TPA: HAMP domain-containing sensor histidine kinase [Pyrinomonadaceae bacterium]|nr:HAMP domain-containing sensor histidine kinase [Pyrinomonadaceae bacterium]